MVPAVTEVWRPQPVALLLQSYGDTRTVHAVATASEIADLVPLPVP